MASAAAGDRLNVGRLRQQFTRLLSFPIAIGQAVAAGCGAPPADDLVPEFRVAPVEPLVDAETRVQATLRDAKREPVRAARVTIEAHMSHPGMAPVIEPAVESGDGVYSANLRLSMVGEWVLFVRGERDGRSFRHRLGEVAARPPG